MYTRVPSSYPVSAKSLPAKKVGTVSVACNSVRIAGVHGSAGTNGRTDMPSMVTGFSGEK